MRVAGSPFLLLTYLAATCLAQLAFKQPDSNPNTNAIPILAFQADGYASDQANTDRFHRIFALLSWDLFYLNGIFLLSWDLFTFMWSFYFHGIFFTSMGSFLLPWDIFTFMWSFYFHGIFFGKLFCKWRHCKEINYITVMLHTKVCNEIYWDCCRHMQSTMAQSLRFGKIL